MLRVPLPRIRRGFDGYNLELCIRHAGYSNVYWYRDGRESWEVAGKPEDEVRPADW